ncbi:unnamed protein product [Mycena citricolor]|uniref:Uncharacterized protein n=1 Tax=Mycena citricolor TaxID=2018698 RepID=A0AAD2Q0Y8_9AGAR|nr:unnamed protein product [Mycena citricolor]
MAEYETYGKKLKREVDTANVLDYERIRNPVPENICSDVDATSLQNDLLYFLRSVLTEKFEPLVKIRLQRGGWEKWFQVELCLLINHFHDRNNVHALYHATREEQVFQGTRQYADVIISEGNSPETRKLTHLLEIKCGRNNQSASDVAQDIWKDWDKVGGITGNGNGPLQPKLAAASRVAVCVTVDDPPLLTTNWSPYTVNGVVDGQPHTVYFHFRYLTRY